MILVTGGLGYLGSHIALYLMSKGHEVVLVDNLSQSSMETLERLEYITKLYIPFIRLDVRNTPILQKVFEQYPIDYVIHTAGFKNIAESHLRALEYYNNNLGCIMSILRAMQRAGVKRLVNLASAAVYADTNSSKSSAAKEDQSLNYSYANPYVRSQQMIEQILQDTYQVDQSWQIANLRLTNVVGGFSDEKMPQSLHLPSPFGEWTPLMPKSVLPNVLQVAAGQKDVFELAQQDLATEDGSAERNYLHVMDAVDAIYKVMLWSNEQQHFLEHFNVASSEQLTVKQLIELVEQVTGKQITTTSSSQHISEYSHIHVNPQKITDTVNWSAQFTVKDAIQSQWLYYQNVLYKDAHQYTDNLPDQEDEEPEQNFNV